MTLFDGLLLFLIVAAAAWQASPHAARGRVTTAVVLVVLALVHGATEGFTWQFVPGSLVILAVGVAAISPPRRPRRLLGLGWAAGMVVAVVPWTLFVSVPQVTPPEGPFPVGTKVYRWIDESRPEEATPTPDDRRNVIVQAWYPGVPGAQGDLEPYLDSGPSGDSVGVLPGFLLGRFGQTETHARVGIPVSTDQPSWPVLIFLTGYGGVRGVYTSVVAGLASWGFVVLAVDHPYEAAVVELADGTLARTVEDFQPGDQDRTGFMEGRLALRVADVKFVLDQLGQSGRLGPGWEGRVDLDRIGIVGHSFGGASGAAAMAADHRIVGAVNLDGTLYGPIPGTTVRRPFLVIESDREVTHHSDRYREGNQALAR